MTPTEAILIGAGQRGQEAIGAFALQHPDSLKFIAVAEPNEGRRNQFANAHDIPLENRFENWEAILAQPRMAELCFNTTMDKTHRDSALAALEAGYHLFLEKPMADEPQGCVTIADKARETGRLLQICHPLRFSPFYTKVRELLDEGKIGRILAISMVENVAFWHYAHSYVRGNWRRADESGPTILTKCCHDMDVATWLTNSRVRHVSSHGSLRYFHEGNAPEGAPARCTDGCPVEKTCPFFAPAFYLQAAGRDWPLTKGPVPRGTTARMEALRTGDYGRCVYRCDNSVVDHQAVIAEFENDVILNFSLYANTTSCYRTIRIIGTEGELNGVAEKREIRISRFSHGFSDEAIHEIHQSPVGGGAHGGGDHGVIANFLRLHGEKDFNTMGKSLDIAVEGHLLAFAAEKARLENRTLSMAEYRKSLK